MKKNFWEDLKKPIICLAPMYHVTDCAFREVIAKYGKPDIMFTEFASVDGLNSEGRDRLMHLLEYTEIQR
ncbi:MAG: tRNA-dihydrouridine synthase, partial [Ignavibacteriae bacterium]|nr:tRNA-dihydrouridine synthase [Ignavibacteriota bacterium]